jgi:hypothetical protein
MNINSTNVGKTANKVAICNLVYTGSKCFLTWYFVASRKGLKACSVTQRCRVHLDESQELLIR